MKILRNPKSYLNDLKILDHLSLSSLSGKITFCPPPLTMQSHYAISPCNPTMQSHYAIPPCNLTMQSHHALSPCNPTMQSHHATSFSNNSRSSADLGRIRTVRHLHLRLGRRQAQPDKVGQTDRGHQDHHHYW
jgi:hypothetical protein